VVKINEQKEVGETGIVSLISPVDRAPGFGGEGDVLRI